MSSRAYESIINAAADAEGVPHAVAQALVDTENASRNPRAYNPDDPGGSYGIAQITARTARAMGHAGDPSQLLYDVGLAARLSFRYLRQMFDQVGKGRWTNAAAAYNAGPDLQPWPAAYVARFAANLERWTREYGGAGVGFQTPPVLRAGTGGLTALVVLGFGIPMLFQTRRRRRRRKGRR